VVHAIRAHHEEPETVLDHIIIAADATSGARPGARRELLESYLKRLEDLEAIPKSFKGINEAYAFQAGREIRVLVNPDVIGDAELTILCRDIAQKIEQDLTYPGQIKVSVIRQTRVEDVAK
jgi:ribonuclease Y